MKFVKFEEYNDWEGETWRFWLQLDGNEESLKKLVPLVKEADAHSGGNEYRLDLNEILDEREVDTLVKYTQSGYMDNDNKVVGTLKLTDDMVKRSEGDNDDPFYKGGVRGYFK